MSDEPSDEPSDDSPDDAAEDAANDAATDTVTPTPATSVVETLGTVTAALPGGMHRSGQMDMAVAVQHAIDQRRHLVVQAGTGTGKTLAYLVPVIASGRRTVVVTATKALQDQLATKDLPFLAEHLDVDAAVLKGRNNYLCRQRLHEVENASTAQLDVGTAGEVRRDQIQRLSQWAQQTSSGDRAELDWAVHEATWRALSVGSDECPGARNCPHGHDCFAELARDAARDAQVIVVNTHLYGQHVSSGGEFLPEHDVVVFDEAHGLEDIISATVGVELSGGRLTAVAAAIAQVIADSDLPRELNDLAGELRDLLGPRSGERLGPPLPDDVQELLNRVRLTLDHASGSLRAIEQPAARRNEDLEQRRLRAMTMIGRLSEAIDTAGGAGTSSVAFASGRPEAPRLEIAPLDVGPSLKPVWDDHVAILTSATIPSSIVPRLALPEQRVDVLDVGSPFDYESQSLLYCTMKLPDRRDADFEPAVHHELEQLITAAGGRTLALFTSWAALDRAVEALRPRLDVPVLSQRDLPQPALIEQFSADESTCVFATAGFFQGVDVPGSTLSLVTIDKLPFPRPDDPLLSARRDELGRAAFAEIDLPRAATLLAQAAGRLIRSSSDRGVVAVFDRRLGAAGYRWDIIRALPPMRRTAERTEALAFLREISS